MDIYEALYTTRAMRRVKPDAIPQEVQNRIMDAAIRAPSGGNELLTNVNEIRMCSEYADSCHLTTGATCMVERDTR